MKMAMVKPKPIMIAFVVFAILYDSVQILIQFIGPYRINEAGPYQIVQISGLLPWIIGGYTAAWLGKGLGVLYGIALVPLTAITQQVDCLTHFDASLHTCTTTTFAGYTIYGLIFAGLGGGIWDIQRLIRKRRLAARK